MEKAQREPGLSKLFAPDASPADDPSGAASLFLARLHVAKDTFRNQAGVFPDRLFDPGGGLRILLQESFGVLATLAEPLAVI